MGYEIERKFRVHGEDWKEGAAASVYRQGYLCTEPGRTVRVRRAGERGFLTVKGPSEGAGRAEFEFEIPLRDADEMLDSLCLRPLVEKIRWKLCHAGHGWEVDEFQGDNAGLVLAEIELASEDEPFERPSWLADEVTDDGRYYNVNLVRHPYSTWGL